MRPDDGAVDHEIPFVAVCRLRLEHPLPDTGMAPAAETPVYRQFDPVFMTFLSCNREGRAAGGWHLAIS